MMEKRAITSKRFKGITVLFVGIYLAFAIFFDGKGAPVFSRSVLSTDRSLATSEQGGDEHDKTPNEIIDNSKRNLDATGDPNLSAWIVIYNHFVANVKNTEQWMLSYEMFHNKEVYQKILYVWDSTQGDDLNALHQYVPENLRDDFITIDVATEMSEEKGYTNIKASFATAHLANNCFGRGLGYCEMLYMKMNLDETVKAAAVKYDLEVPEILGLSDGDAYLMSMPVKDNIIDPAGRIIFHTYECLAGYAAGAASMLHTDKVLNGMAVFPMHVWMDTLPAMRQKIVEIARQEETSRKLVSGTPSVETFLDVFAREMSLKSDENDRKLEKLPASDTAAEVHAAFLDVYLSDGAGVSEFCVMATYASIYEPERYKFTQAPCPMLPEVVTPTNSFLEAPVDPLEPLPMITLMRHEKAGPDLIHPLWASTLNMWVYGCCVTYGITPEEAPICEGKVAEGYKELAGYHQFAGVKNGFSSPTILTDHFERVHATLERRPMHENVASKAVCLRHLEAIADEYSRCEVCKLHH